jgi:protein-disulfide isomerase
MTQTSTQVRYPKRRASGPKASKVPKAPRRARAWLISIAVVVAAFVAGGVVIATQLAGGGDASSTKTMSLFGIADNAALFEGIPQHGNVLGSPQAPVTLVEYADLQCPYCGGFARNALPSLVDDYVRTGKVKLVFRGLAFVGPESETALRTVIAAGEQNRLWNVAHLMYTNQGPENTGWVTNTYLRSVAGAVPGIDVAQLDSRTGNASVTETIARDAHNATADGVGSTPSFLVGRTGGTLRPLEVSKLEAASFRPALQALLG